MSYNASQFEGIIDALHGKNYRGISKDQDELLNNEKSWIQQLKRNPHGVVNVPNHVLRTVTDAYSAAKLGQANSCAPVSEPALVAVSKAREASPLNETTSSQPAPEEAVPKPTEAPRPNGMPMSSPVRYLSSWSQSPEPPRRMNHVSLSSSVKETPRPNPASLAHPKSLAKTRNPLGVLPVPGQDEEEEMEVQVPQGLMFNRKQETGQGEPLSSPVRSGQVVRLTQQHAIEVANTPPCAQPDNEVIPDTVMASEAKRKLDLPTQKPRKRMKPISLDDTSPIKARQGGFIPGGIRMQSFKNLEPRETQDTSTSSPIATTTQTQTQTQSDSTPAKTGAEDARVSTAGNAVSGAKRGNSEGGEVTREPPRAETQAQSAGSPVNTSPSPSPLMAFHNAYPDYIEEQNGSRRLFVKACICLHYLRLERGLRDYLYDDFIRMFSAKYVDYVNKAGPNREPLTAIEWFNMQQGRPLYTQQIISNETLDQVLAFYSQDVESLRSTISPHAEDDDADKTTAAHATPARPPREAEAERTRWDEVAVGAVAGEDGGGEEDEQHFGADLDLLFSLPDATPQSLGSASPAGSAAGPERPPRAAASVSLADEQLNDADTTMATRKETTPSRHPRRLASPQLGSPSLAGVPPSSARSCVPAGTQYMQNLSAWPSSTDEAAARRRMKIQAAMRKRVSAAARSSSGRVGSVA